MLPHTHTHTHTHKLIDSPAEYHEFVQGSATASRRRQSATLTHKLNTLRGGRGSISKSFDSFNTHIHVSILLERFVSETPYLIHETPKTPHITGCRVPLVVEGL